MQQSILNTLLLAAPIAAAPVVVDPPGPVGPIVAPGPVGPGPHPIIERDSVSAGGSVGVNGEPILPRAVVQGPVVEPGKPGPNVIQGPVVEPGVPQADVNKRAVVQGPVVEPGKPGPNVIQPPVVAPGVPQVDVNKRQENQIGAGASIGARQDASASASIEEPITVIARQADATASASIENPIVVEPLTARDEIAATVTVAPRAVISPPTWSNGPNGPVIVTPAVVDPGVPQVDVGNPPPATTVAPRAVISPPTWSNGPNGPVIVNPSVVEPGVPQVDVGPAPPATTVG